jgi:hypothetical protein
VIIAFYTIQSLLILAGLFFLYQCAVFIWHFGKGLLNRENGITFGLFILYMALFFGGLWTAFDAAMVGADLIYGPFGLITIPKSTDPYIVLSAAIRLVIMAVAIIGNHLLYFALRKAK